MAERFPPRSEHRHWLIVGFLALTAESTSARAEEGRSGAGEGTVDVRVVAAEGGGAFPGAAVSVRLLTRMGRIHADRATTDEYGRCRLRIPGGAWNFAAISARKPGYAPVRLCWHDDRLRAGLPTSCTLRLWRGMTIGGVVRDERGRPVAAARVYPHLRPRPLGEGPEEAALDDDDSVETDAQGQWSFATVPDDLRDDHRLAFRLAHPDYVSDGEPYCLRTLPVALLRAGAGAFLMRDGIPLEGRVVDSKGRPAAGARVSIERTHAVPPSGITRTRADARGRFRFAHVDPGPGRLTATADGFASVREAVTVRPGRAPVEVRLLSREEGRARREAEYRRWLGEDAGQARWDAGAWRRWLMFGVLGLAALALLTSWARERLQSPRAPDTAPAPRPSPTLAPVPAAHAPGPTRERPLATREAGR
jgi:hypothetical protein